MVKNINLLLSGVLWLCGVLNASVLTSEQLQALEISLGKKAATAEMSFEQALSRLHGEKRQQRSVVSFRSASSLPLFQRYAALSKSIAHLSFCALPTPITEGIACAQTHHIKALYIKRDDLTGDGETLLLPVRSKASRPQGTKRIKFCNRAMLSSWRNYEVANYGGNKSRKLEWILADAQSRGCTHIFTVGDAGSNHAVATAWYTPCVSVPTADGSITMRCSLYLFAQQNANNVRQNLMLDAVTGAEIVYAASEKERNDALITAYQAACQKGEVPYLIPSGGSYSVGVLGYVNAALELKQQIDAGLMPEPDYIYVAFGSAGTTAGLLLGLKLAGLSTKVKAIAASHESKPGAKIARLKEIYEEANNLLHRADSSVPLVSFDETQFERPLDWVGKDFGYFTQAGIDAQSVAETMFDLELDGSYSAKAFAALLDDAQKGLLHDKTVLFWNTYCGLDYSGVTEACDYQQLSPELHRYFEQRTQEEEVQKEEVESIVA